MNNRVLLLPLVFQNVSIKVSNVDTLTPAYFRSSAWDMFSRILKSRFKVLKSKRVPSSSQHSLCNLTYISWLSLLFKLFARTESIDCSSAALLYSLQDESITSYPPLSVWYLLGLDRHITLSCSLFLVLNCLGPELFFNFSTSSI